MLERERERGALLYLKNTCVLRVTDLDGKNSWYLPVAGHEIFGKNYRVLLVIFGEP